MRIHVHGKTMKKSIFFALSLIALAAQAQSFQTGLVNTGSISNSVKTSAVSSGVGSAYSAATGSAGAVANGGLRTEVNPNCLAQNCCGTSGSATIRGNVATYNTASAFNV